MSRRMLIAAAAAVALLFFGAALAGAQDHTPQPYNPDEFQPWMKQLFRAEAIFVGSFPFTLFFTLEAYDSWRYASNQFKPAYAPFPLGSGTPVSYSGDETFWIVMSAVSMSLVIAGMDYLIGQVNDRSSPP